MRLWSKPLLRQVTLYGIIGGSCALLDFSIFTVLHAIIGINELIVNVLSAHGGMTMSFILNSKYNFRKTDKLLFRAGAFYLTGLFGMTLSSSMIWFGGKMGFPILLVKFVSIFAAAAVQFTMNKLIAFKK